MQIPLRKIILVLIFIILVFLVIHTLLVFNGYENLRWLLIIFQNKFGFTYNIDRTLNNLFKIVDLRFNLDSETSIPTWFSTILLYSVTVISYVNYAIYRRFLESEVKKRRFWLILGALFLFLSLDEGAMLHELLNFRPIVKWVYFYAPLMSLFFLYFFFHLIAHRRSDRNLILWVLGGLFLMGVGGIFVEFLEFFYGWENEIEEIGRLFEEGFEMLGVSFVLMGGVHEFGHLSQTMALFQKNN